MDQKTIEDYCNSLNKILLKYREEDIEPELKKELQSNSKYVILFGVTGVGKTTLLNFLRGAEMKCEDKITHTEKKLKDDLENQKYKIGHTNSSETLRAVHSIINFNQQNIVLIDTPDYGGTREEGFSEEEQQWLDSLNLRRLLKKCTNCCFLLIMTQESINEKENQLKIDKFYKFLQQLTGIQDEQKLSKMIRIVFNKIDREYETSEHLKNWQEQIDEQNDQLKKHYLKRYLQILKQGFVQVQKERETKIGFSTPEKKKEILELIQSMETCKTEVQHPFQNQAHLNQILINISFSFNEQVVLFDVFIKETLNCLKTKYIQKVQKFMDNFPSQQPIQINEDDIDKIYQISDSIKRMENICRFDEIGKKNIYNQILDEIKSFIQLAQSINVQTGFCEELFEKYYQILKKISFQEQGYKESKKYLKRTRLQTNQLQKKISENQNKALSDFHETILQLKEKFKKYYNEIEQKVFQKEQKYKSVLIQLKEQLENYQDDLVRYQPLVEQWCFIDNQGLTLSSMYWNEERKEYQNKLRNYKTQDQQIDKNLCNILEIEYTQYSEINQIQHRITLINQMRKSIIARFENEINELSQADVILNGMKKSDENYSLAKLQHKFEITKKQFELIKDIIVTIEQYINEIHKAYDYVNIKFFRGFLRGIWDFVTTQNYYSKQKTLYQIKKAEDYITQLLKKIDQKYITQFDGGIQQQQQ